MRLEIPIGASWSEDLDIISLLGRPPLPLDLAVPRERLRGRDILITGAGGSIGVALSHTLRSFAPARLILLDNHEPSLYAIQQHLQAEAPTEVECILADVRDRGKILRVCETFRPHYIFHLAAYKHVPLGEANPDQVLATNLLGTRNMAEAAVAAGCLRLVYPSTDKAVGPVNVYGATKRAAELLLTATQVEAAGASFAIARLVNAVGAQGGVIRLFVQQILAGQPLTLTHPEMTRFWISIDEAVNFLILASVAETVLGAFILDLGEPVGLLHIAKRLAALVKGREEDPEVIFVGLRPGERLFEALASPAETVVATDHQGLLAALPARPPDAPRIRAAVGELESMLQGCEPDRLLRELYSFVHADWSAREP